MYYTGHRKFNILAHAVLIFNITASWVPLNTLHSSECRCNPLEGSA